MLRSAHCFSLSLRARIAAPASATEPAAPAEIFCVPADQSSHCHADAVKGGEISSMALAMEREQTAYKSLLMVAGAVLTDPEPMLARLVRGCIALAFTACVLAVACSHRLVDAVKGGEVSSMALAMEREQTAY